MAVILACARLICAFSFRVPSLQALFAAEQSVIHSHRGLFNGQLPIQLQAPLEPRRRLEFTAYQVQQAASLRTSEILTLVAVVRLPSGR